MNKDVRDISFQIKHKSEAQDLEIIDKFIELGWEKVSVLKLGNEVYFLRLHWPNTETPVYPEGYLQ